MTLEQLRAFVAVVEAGTFSSAARRLAKSQSAVSKLVKNLEEELGVELLDREPYRPVPTAPGRVLHERALGLLRDALHLEQLGARLGGAAEAFIRVSVVRLAHLAPVLTALLQLREVHPEVGVELASSPIADPSAQLLDGELELAISAVAPTDPRLLAAPYDTLRIVPVVAADHPLAEHERIPVEAFRAHPQIVLQDDEPARSINVLAGSLRWRVTDIGAKRDIIASGLGWGGLPEHVVRDELDAGTLVAIEGEPFETTHIALFVIRRVQCGPVTERMFAQLSPAGPRAA